jgi:porin
MKSVALISTILGATLSITMISTADAQEVTKPWSYSGNYTADIIGVVSGGLDRDVRYIDNFGFQLNYDGSAHGLHGLSASFGILYNNLASINELTGDAQGISNIETGVAALRPYENWIAKTWGENAAMLKVGLIDLNANFDAPGTSALFLNPSHGINASFAQTGENGPSIFPTLGLAVMAEAKLSSTMTIRGGGFDAVPGDPDKPERTDLAWRQSDGALLVGEVEFEAGRTRFVAGSWGYTKPSDALFMSDRQARNWGLYGTGEFKVNDAVSYFVRAGHAAQKLNPVANYFAAGAVWTGPVSSRNDDQLGIASAHARFSDTIVSRALSKEAETNVELTYAAPLNDAITLQGDIQYVVTPNGDASIDNALVVGMRLKFGFGS